MHTQTSQAYWSLTENLNNTTYKTIIHKNLIKHIKKINQKIHEIYTLTLNTNYLHFSQWNKTTLHKTSHFSPEPIEYNSKKHITLSIKKIRSKPFHPGENYSSTLHQELFGIPYILGKINYNSPLAQQLYKNPGYQNASMLILGNNNQELIEKIIITNSWNELEWISKCKWNNKIEIIQNVGCNLSGFMIAFHSPQQFKNLIHKINTMDLWRIMLTKPNFKIPPELNSPEEINHYLKKQLTQIPKSLQNINKILNETVMKKERHSNSIIIETQSLKLQINLLSPYPILSTEPKLPPETEILICEELKMRSPKYTPSQLIKYSL